MTDGKADGSAFKVSDGPGELPQWSDRGDGFYYRLKQRWFWVALNEDRTGFENPEFRLQGNFLQVAGWEYEVLSTGKSPEEDELLLLEAIEPPTQATLFLITNLRAELQRKLGR